MGPHRSAAGTARTVCAGVKRAAAHWRRCASAGAVRAVFAGAARARRSAGRHGERLAEVVSPVCRYEDIEMVQAVVRAIRAAGAKADRSCGIHIHIGLGEHTIEFRAFNGTLHAGEIKAYIQLCLAISAQAMSTKAASSTRPVTDNPKYTFRCWLLRLGFIGDEFSTAREHLLKKLPGNAA